LRANRSYPIVAEIVAIVTIVITLPYTAEAARPEPGTVGVNLGGLYSWGEQIPFVDVFKMSSLWLLHSVTSPNNREVPRDLNGWVARLAPGEYAETTVFKGSGGHYPAGQYTLIYDGKGALDVGGDGVSVMSAEPGRILLQVQPTGGPNNGIRIRETSVDPSAPIKNIHLFLPGFTAEPKGNPFNPAFLDVLKPFKVIRFVGWAHPDRSETSTWSDERPITSATQASEVTARLKLGGVSLEYEIQLANLLHADPWFLVPLKADDNFVRNMATLVRDRLDPSLHPYVELSNEVWNISFPEAAYARDMGQKLGLDSDPAKAAAKWYAGQAVHVFDVWNSVFGPDASRTVRVLGGAYPLPPLTEAELSYQDAYKHVDVLAIAPYILPKSLGDYDAVSRMTPDQVLDQVQADVTGKFRDFTRYHLAITRKYGVDLVAYEGGPGLMSPHAPPSLLPRIGEILRAASESPRMAGIYQGMLDEWFSLGGTLFNHFDDCSPPGPWGDFGLVDYQFQDPKSSELLRMFSGYIASRRGPSMSKAANLNVSEPHGPQ
jgi:hypothetical protein